MAKKKKKSSTDENQQPQIIKQSHLNVKTTVGHYCETGCWQCHPRSANITNDSVDKVQI